MNDNWNVNPIRTKDGRYAEERTQKSVNADSCYDHYEAEEVKETWEEERPLVLKERVREVKKPMVVERVIEKVDGDEVVERKVESVDNNSQMRLVDHIGMARPSVSAQQNIDDCTITREEFAELLKEQREESNSQIRELVDGLKNALTDNNYQSHSQESSSDHVSNVTSMQSFVEENTKEDGKWGVFEWVLLGVIGVEAAYIFINIVMPMLGG